MNIKQIDHCALTVTNLEHSLKWFQQVFGFDIIHKWQTTWNQLSTSFQRKGGGYSEYVNWWNNVREIRIGQIRLIEQNNYEALVSADLTYITSTATYYNDTKNRIYLTWNSQSNTWLFEKKF